MILGFAVLIILAVLMLASVRTANQYERAVVFFLGRYARTAGPGLGLASRQAPWNEFVGQER